MLRLETLSVGSVSRSGPSGAKVGDNDVGDDEMEKKKMQKKTSSLANTSFAAIAGTWWVLARCS